MSRNNNKFSRFLSSLLRHRAVELGYDMDDSGFVSVAEILKRCSTVTFEQIQEIVNTNDKKRFELKQTDGEWYIRAVQGHSIALAAPQLELITDPSEIPIVVHGTNKKSYLEIQKTGLNKMSRTHIHFAHGTVEDTTVVSGMRKSADVMIYIDVPKAMADGIKFYRSSNGVILSDGIDGVISPEYFSFSRQA